MAGTSLISQSQTFGGGRSIGWSGDRLFRRFGSDDARFLENNRLDRRSVISCCVLKVRIEVGRNDRAVLGDFKENVLGILRRAIEPVGIVERTAIYADNIGESLKAEK